MSYRGTIRRQSCALIFLAVLSLPCWYLIYVGCCQASLDDLEVFLQRHSSEQASLLRAIATKDFAAVTRTNQNYTLYHTRACVVDPAVCECSVMGLAAFLLLTLDHISVCKALDISHVTVFWRGCHTVCSVDTAVNSWRWYFEPVNPRIETMVRKALCISFAGGESITELAHQTDKTLSCKFKPVLSSSFRNRSNVPGFEAGTVIDAEERRRVHHLMSQYVKPNAAISKEVNDFYRRHLAGYNLLGVHVRGTDHWMETPNGKLPPLDHWIKNTATIFESLPHPRKLFVASDNNETVFKFVKYFGKNNVSYTRAYRADNYRGKAPHDTAVLSNIDPQTLGTQVLMDILLLAKCDHFLHAESSVAAAAAYFNPRMKSHFLEDLTDTKSDDGHVREMEKPENVHETAYKAKELSVFAACFRKNSQHGACPNGAKALFVDIKEAKNFITS